jgi:hypothetical protein
LFFKYNQKLENISSRRIADASKASKKTESRGGAAHIQ